VFTKFVDLGMSRFKGGAGHASLAGLASRASREGFAGHYGTELRAKGTGLKA
jgi:hypothetical protein